MPFGSNKLRSVNVRALSKTGATLQIRLNNADGPLIAQVKFQKEANGIFLKQLCQFLNREFMICV